MSSSDCSTASTTPTGRLTQVYAASMNPQACLVALPNELLVEIAKHLKRKDLFNLGMVNRSLSNIAMPLIYAEGIDPSMSLKSRAAFACRIDEDPTLAKLVKKVHFRYAFTKPMKYQRGVGPNGELPGTLVLNEHLTAIHDRATDRELQILSTSVAAAMWVEELVIEDTSFRAVDEHRTDTMYWAHLVYNGATALPSWTQPFSHLKSLKVRFPREVAGWVRLENFLPVIGLPCIEELHLQGFVETQPPQSWDYKPRSSNVKVLILQGAFLHWQIVSYLVESCKALEYFHYTYTALMSARPGFNPPGFHPNKNWAPHSWAGIGHALQTQKDSLRGLEILYVVDYVRLARAAVFHPVYAWQIGTLGSFADFDNLVHLRVPVDALIPAFIVPGAGSTYLAERLPVGLETLTMRYDRNTELAELQCIQSIMAVIASNKGRKLRRLHLILADDVPFQKYSIGGCKEADIQFVITRTRSHWSVGRVVYCTG
ncbi:uncharacterized protein N0V89_011875 [Didymosphaeria variabile]|uniref:F-box domain-containing protein n=1 Tax=Didymosphaeria variabile TaxID=1932322 RepID=A0A9W8XAJ5_9PLEO|nr:uncharacterized protein N0V89_011875 [Didymosphaeria variabile]KAJ4345740.1 hypothetical protein N0V89_011875 [Didymosphaeria variabile]